LIGDACWIGANVLINPGVTIGENSVVGANNVVTRDVPPGEVWGGVPAKFIRKKKSGLMLSGFLCVVLLVCMGVF